jgi:hypothetical protein
MKVKARPAKSVRRNEREAADLNFGPRNYAILGAALAAILIGFVLLSRGSITAAPILLVLGYCVLVPYGLATGRKTSALGE